MSSDTLPVVLPHPKVDTHPGQSKVDADLPQSIAIDTIYATECEIRYHEKVKELVSNFSKGEELSHPFPGPDYVNTLVHNIAINSNIANDKGPNNEIIHCQPDYRNIFITLTSAITKIYSSMDEKTSPDLTPPSLIEYLLALVYGHALISDCSARGNMAHSYYSEFKSEDARSRFLENLRLLEVPDFLLPLLTSLSSTCDPRRTGINFIHSLACFLLNMIMEELIQ